MCEESLCEFVSDVIDGCEEILNFFKGVKCYLQIYPDLLKIFNNEMSFFFCLKHIHKFKNYN